MTQKEKIDLLFEIDSAIESITDSYNMDYCGAWCNVSVLNSMLRTPTYSNSIKHLISLIGFRIETAGDIENLINDENIKKLLIEASANGICIYQYENFID